MTGENPVSRLVQFVNRYVYLLYVCFVALRNKSTAMVMVHLNTLFPGQAVNQYFVHILSLVTDNNPS